MGGIMPMRILSYFRNLFRKRAVEQDLDDELRSSVELLTQEKMKQGLSQSAARREALIELGGIEQVKEEVRDVRAGRILEDFARDIRFAFRSLAKSPSFTVVAVLTLALGIGANTAIFSMVNGVILSSLSYRQPQQLYVINEDVPQFTRTSPWGPWFPVNAGNFILWQGNCPAISSMALVGPASFNLTGHGIPRQVNGVRVSADFFSMLGIRPELGRPFLPEEDQIGRDHEVILTAQFWRQVFKSDPRIIGKTIVLDSAPYTVVGIMPESFRFPQILPLSNYTPEFFKPIGLQKWDLWSGLGGFNFVAIARLKPEANPKQALAQLDVVEARIARGGDARRHFAPGEFDLKALMRPLKTVILGPAQRALWMLMAAAGFVLLIVCVNLANLMLVRNFGKTHEVAIRSALGASAERLVRQFFAEGLILAATGGALGLLFAKSALQLLVRNAPLSIPRVGNVGIDGQVLLVAIGLTFTTAVLFGLLPALRLSKVVPADALKSEGRTAGATRQSTRLRSLLVVTQIGLCGVLLVGALLLIESLHHVARANQWMDEQDVLALDLAVPPSETQTAQFFSNVEARVQALPGVKSAGLTSKLPLQGASFGDDIDFQEAPHPPDQHEIGQFRFVSPGYFQAIGLPLIRGRLLSNDDHGKDVALISESVAQKLLPPGRNPIGMHLMWGQGRPKPREIIGEVADVRNASDESPIMAVYLPLWTFYQTSETLVVRTAMDPSAAADSIRRAVWSVDPEVAIPRERTLKTVVMSSEAVRRYETLLASVFAAFAVLLAALGLYGVIAYSVSQRTQEIGVRVALGADQRDVLRMVMGQGLRLALIGVAIGIAGALGLMRLISTLLYGVKPTDPLTFIAVSFILMGVALLASYIPARRATKVDPLVALRYE
jgi:putative ABC transport system permease protein